MAFGSALQKWLHLRSSTKHNQTYGIRRFTSGQLQKFRQRPRTIPREKFRLLSFQNQKIDSYKILRRGTLENVESQS